MMLLLLQLHHLRSSRSSDALINHLLLVTARLHLLVNDQVVAHGGLPLRHRFNSLQLLLHHNLLVLVFGGRLVLADLVHVLLGRLCRLLRGLRRVLRRGRRHLDSERVHLGGYWVLVAHEALCVSCLVDLFALWEDLHLWLVLLVCSGWTVPLSVVRWL